MEFCSMSSRHHRHGNWNVKSIDLYPLHTSPSPHYVCYTTCSSRLHLTPSHTLNQCQHHCYSILRFFFFRSGFPGLILQTAFSYQTMFVSVCFNATNHDLFSRGNRLATDTYRHRCQAPSELLTFRK